MERRRLLLVGLVVAAVVAVVVLVVALAGEYLPGRLASVRTRGTRTCCPLSLRLPPCSSADLTVLGVLRRSRSEQARPVWQQREAAAAAAAHGPAAARPRPRLEPCRLPRCV